MLLISWIFTALLGQGLEPYQPPQASEISKDIHLQAEDSSMVIRSLNPSDKVKYLRSQGAWYEVDVQTQDGLSFRGWLKGSPPAELNPPKLAPLPSAPPPPKKTDPLSSNRFFWLWSDRVQDRGSLSLGIGLQEITYALNGIANQQRFDVYNYDFLGLALDVEAHLSLLEFAWGPGRASWNIGGAFGYGLFNLNFSPGFQVSELRGKGYSITTHSYDFETTFRYAFKAREALIGIAVGPAFFLYEVLPDLSTTITFQEAILGDLTMQGLAPLGLSADLKYKKFKVRARGLVLLFLSDLNETAVNNPNLKVSGLPLILQAQGLWAFSDSWSLSLGIDYLSASGESKGAGSRLNTNYEDGTLAITRLRGSLGFNYQF